MRFSLDGSLNGRVARDVGILTFGVRVRLMGGRSTSRVGWLALGPGGSRVGLGEIEIETEVEE